MLVRILSYVASVLGSARHRAVLVSCLVLVFATSSVVGIMAMHDGQTKTAATAENADRKTSQENTIWLHEQEIDNKNTVKEAESTDTSDGEQVSSEQGGTDSQQAPDTVAEPTPAQPTMTVSTSAVSVPAGSTSEAVIVRVGDENTDGSSWTIQLANEYESNGITVTDLKTDKGLLSFRVHVNSSAASGTYRIAIHASQNENTNPTLTDIVTVNVSAANSQ